LFEEDPDMLEQQKKAQKDQERVRQEYEENKRLIALDVQKKPADIDDKKLDTFIGHIFTQHGNLRTFRSATYEHREHQVSVRGLYKDRERLTLGFKRVLTLLLTTCYGKVLNDAPVGLGVKQVQGMFDCSHSVACLVRAAIMEYISKATIPYVKKKLVTCYYIIKEKIECFFKAKVDLVVRIANSMGNGNTFQTIKTYTPLLVDKMGFISATEILYAALEMSNANDKRQRQRDIESLGTKVEEGFIYAA
jgi:hypothetical protein